MAYTSDSRGRILLSNQEFRGALVSGFATCINGDPTQLVAGDSDYFLDIVELEFANNSTLAAQVSIVSDGTVLRSLIIPASSSLQFSYINPLRQVTKATPWNIDMEDITGTTITVGATLIKKPSGT